VVCLALGGAVHWSAIRDVGTGGTVAAATGFPASPPHATGFVPRNMTPSLADVADDLPVMYGDGCHHDVSAESVEKCVYGDPDGAQRIALFGDSHTAQWFPAVESFARDRGGVAVSTYTKSSCPAV